MIYGILKIIFKIRYLKIKIIYNDSKFKKIKEQNIYKKQLL